MGISSHPPTIKQTAIDLFKQTIFWPLAHDTVVEKQSVRSAFSQLMKTLHARVTKRCSLDFSFPCLELALLAVTRCCHMKRQRLYNQVYFLY